MSLDLENDYKKAKDTINSYKTYINAKSSYDSVTEPKGDSLEQNEPNVIEQIDKVKQDAKRFRRKIKNQLEQLLDINSVLSGGKGDGRNTSNTFRYVKNTFVKVLKTIQPIIREILLEEAKNAVRCDSQQLYDSRDIYIKVSALDLFGLLKLDPNSEEGALLFEKKPIDVQTPKFSMNRELYNRIQSNVSFEGEYGGRFFKGASGQDLFDIQFVPRNNLGVTGPWYKISLKNRADGLNKVGQFLVDYYQAISIVDFANIIANIMNALTGCISISANVGTAQNTENTKFALFIQRILGLCFDNVSEIDVSGNAKVGELDGVDQSFYEFTDIDLRQIEQTVQNILEGVTEFENCNNVKFPVNTDVIIAALNRLNLRPEGDEVAAVNEVTDSFVNSTDPNGIGIEGDFKIKVDFNFINKIAEGLVVTLLSPKVLLPIYVMVESTNQYVTDSINSLMVFAKNFGTFLNKIVSRIGAIFVEKLFDIITKDIKQLLQQIIKDLAKEQADIRIIIILKLVQLAIVVAEFVRDWRKCKSVIDEISWLLKIATSGWGKVPGFSGKLPYPLLLFSQFLDGASATREFIGTINEMQKMGIPTGTLPDGSPNLNLLSKFGQMKAQQREKAENGVVEIGMPLAVPITPAFTVSPVKLYGKSF